MSATAQFPESYVYGIDKPMLIVPMIPVTYAQPLSKTGDEECFMCAFDTVKGKCMHPQQSERECIKPYERDKSDIIYLRQSRLKAYLVHMTTARLEGHK